MANDIILKIDTVGVGVTGGGGGGEYIESKVAIGSAVALVPAVPANVTSIELTAGDWDVRGVVLFNPGGESEAYNFATAVHNVSATLPTQDGERRIDEPGGAFDGFPMGMALPSVRFLLVATTTIYLIAQARSITGTCGAFGTISARRIA